MLRKSSHFLPPPQKMSKIRSEIQLCYVSNQKRQIDIKNMVSQTEGKGRRSLSWDRLTIALFKSVLNKSRHFLLPLNECWRSGLRFNYVMYQIKSGKLIYRTWYHKLKEKAGEACLGTGSHPPLAFFSLFTIPKIVHRWLIGGKKTKIYTWLFCL